ncbi:PREDICTED: exocyst complex component EXO70B1-like isoform X2 [Ipomoea nil]|uniref:exocyst complex component EXO70B1-like isoform X2 n=1 Tax=Ipomoea nil TaxID=35883 RepID=UPI000900A021|nr:PREDICTED: exocyst complex component EXO70B1-like isoform X2 [Ipomoea nil]
MGEEKEKFQNETPSSSVDAENQNQNHHHDENQKPEAARNEEQCVEHTEKPASVEADEGRTASDDHQETTSGGGDHQEEEEEEKEKIEAGDGGEEEGATTKNEDGEEGEGEEEKPRYLPPDLSKVSEEVDQYISDNDTLLESRGGGGDDDESSKSSPPPPDEVPIYVEQFALLLEDLLQGYNTGGEAAVKWRELEEEDAASLLEAVNRICRLYTSISQFYSPERQKYAKSISRVGGVLHRAMRFVEEEFRSCLDDYKFPDPPAPPQQPDPASDDPAPDDPASGDPDPGNDETEENKEEEEEEKEKVKEEVDSSGESQQLPAEDPPEETTPPQPPPYFPGYPEEMVSKLNRLAKAMIFGGYETECCQVYFVARKNALEETLRGKLGFEGYSIDDVQKMNWETAEREISTWMAAFKHSATVLFSCERKLADAVFNDCPQLSTTSEAIFIGLSGGLIIQFLIFPEAIAMTKRSAEKLFKFLDLYETMRDNLPTAYENFPPDYITELKAEAALTRGRLGEAMVGIFSELENSIQSDSNKTPVPGGAVHPLSRYTMNYLKLAGDYMETLEQVFKDHWKIETGSDFEYNSEQSKSHKPPTAPKQSPFELQIRKVMELLDANLELKSKLYKDLPLCSIFMMNNGRYILQKVRESPQLTELMGDQWARKQSQELRQYHKTYQRETWGRLLQCLSMEGLMSSGSRAST